ncbi:hypothetical protein C5C95_14965 [Rathayibacter sp. AY1B7]|uniref:hypothetical protein n=1 Tax=unclassified Rathayibacter TaxID=2609250 RepID=UPI000CE875CA|nr:MULTISPECIES: hypothetical protein [unclassified Rathayibacter]PPH86349.1 hypothetical protein C5C64_15300 [Rathayibacter sp. AY1D3]PPH95993.1 hypothetical protein C5C95_14965 [Rathayibacter sp. AY1B7]
MTSAHLGDELHAWAAGDKGREAATELLIRAGLANADAPWILHDTGWSVYAVDYDRALHGHTGLTSADVAILTLAAALAEGTHISIRHVTQQLDYEHARHALTAIAHAAGYHQPTRTTDNTGPMLRIV